MRVGGVRIKRETETCSVVKRTASSLEINTNWGVISRAKGGAVVGQTQSGRTHAAGSHEYQEGMSYPAEKNKTKQVGCEHLP